MDPVLRTVESYDIIAESYSKNTMELSDRDFQEKMIDRTLRSLPHDPHIIDMGCGDGRDTAYLKSKGTDVVGIDLSKNMVRVARKKYPDCTFLQMDMRETVFPDGTFDCAWASASIINLPKNSLNTLEKEVFRILADEGVFAFSFKIGEKEGFEEHDYAQGHPRYFSYYTLDELKERFNRVVIYDSVKYPKKLFDSEFMYCWAKKGK
ncbi:MAG: class I SAM-dependent methyltransferase [Thermoplasmata archaeon]